MFNILISTPSSASSVKGIVEGDPKGVVYGGVLSIFISGDSRTFDIPVELTFLSAELSGESPWNLDVPQASRYVIAMADRNLNRFLRLFRELAKGRQESATPALLFLIVFFFLYPLQQLPGLLLIIFCYLDLHDSDGQHRFRQLALDIEPDFCILED